MRRCGDDVGRWSGWGADFGLETIGSAPGRQTIRSLTRESIQKAAHWAGAVGWECACIVLLEVVPGNSHDVLEPFSAMATDCELSTISEDQP